MASLKAQIGEYEAAAKLYEEALDEIRINMGKGTAYKITEDNLRQITVFRSSYKFRFR